MTDDQNLGNVDNSNESDTSARVVESGDKVVNSGRRKFAQAGLAAPVLLSIVNRTAWAGPACAPSAFTSATFASHHPDQAERCGDAAGRSPGYWKNSEQHDWPFPYQPDASIRPNQTCVDLEPEFGPGLGEPYQEGNSAQQRRCRTGTLFNSVFDCSPLPPEVTLQEALKDWNGSGGHNNIEFHAVAALLNAASGIDPNYGLSVADVVAIFNGLFCNGEYPVGGQPAYWETPRADGFTFHAYFDDYL